jgi:hypothetical protein
VLNALKSLREVGFIEDYTIRTTHRPWRRKAHRQNGEVHQNGEKVVQ